MITDCIDTKLETIISKIENIETKLEQLDKVSNKMNRHIDFIDNVFDIVRKPFFALMNTVSLALPNENSNKIEEDFFPFIMNN